MICACVPVARSETRCRACGRDAVETSLCLGRVPLANDLRSAEDEAAPRYPLHVGCCAACGAVQVTTPPDAEIFGADYPYRSSVNGPMVEQSHALVDRLVDENALGPDDLAVEIGSNDGYLLRRYVERGVPVRGIDPSDGAVAAANDAGVRTILGAFDERRGEQIGRREPATVIHANNVLAHIPDVSGALRGIVAALRPEGFAVIETPSLRATVEGAAWDTLYHEHGYCWSLTAFTRTARRAGLTVYDVEPLTMHGGSLRIFAARAGTVRPRASVTAALIEEARAGVASPAYLDRFAVQVDGFIDSINQRLGEFLKDGARVAAYGAAAKGVMMLNALGMTSAEIRYVVDSTPAKQGLVMPGSGVPIVPPEHLDAEPVDVLLVLAWNFADAIIAREARWLRAGGRFLVPLPTPRVVTWSPEALLPLSE